MKPVVASVVSGFFSALLALSASAQNSTNYLLAPPLAVASDGPVTLSLLGGTSSGSPRVFTWEPFSFGSGLRASGQPYTSSGAQLVTAPLSAGTFITLGLQFSGGFASTVWSTTALAPDANINQLATDYAASFIQNAGVQAGPGGIVVGFNSPLDSQPASIGGFAVRFEVGNVCVN